MENKKLNGFNNGRDTSDGVGGKDNPFESIDKATLNKECRVCDKNKSITQLCDKHYDEFMSLPDENKEPSQLLKEYLDKKYPVKPAYDGTQLIHSDINKEEREAVIEGCNLCLSEIQEKQKDLRHFLITHPDREMVKSACLHFLGDEAQRSEKQTQITEEQFHIIWTAAVGKPGYNKELFRQLLVELKEEKALVQSPKESEQIKCKCPEGKKGRTVDANWHQVCDVCGGY